MCTFLEPNTATKMSNPEHDFNLPPTDQPEAAASTDQPTVEQQLVELTAKHTEVADAYLRAKAEAENRKVLHRPRHGFLDPPWTPWTTSSLRTIFDWR